MREIVEFRIVEEFASKLFSDNEGKRLGTSIRQVEVDIKDVRFARIGQLQKEIHTAFQRSFFHGWSITRRYNKDEMERAACFQLIVDTFFEPAGEECGTKYDEVKGCPECGAGAEQVSDLRLDLRKVPKNKHIACTIANEVIISQRLAERMIDAGLRGFEVRPVWHKSDENAAIDLHKLPIIRKIMEKTEQAGTEHPKGAFCVWLNRAENKHFLEQIQTEFEAKKARASKSMPVFHQLVITSAYAKINAHTRVGIDPFDHDSKGQYRCSRGDLIGLNILSEIWINAEKLANVDVFSSRQYVGTRRGLLRPRRVILISPRMRELLESEKFNGFKLEIAHVC